MSNPEDEKGNGDMQGEKPSGVSRCGVGLRGFESPSETHALGANIIACG
jgi:hypothetical protein